jgi:EAL domain-containing protein (putative c-di-GMP-specific phosphodiesterase class I)
VAEGVESWAQEDFLRRIGCDQVQGFHLSRPLPKEALVAWVEAWGRERPASMRTTPA